jgi:hypothetical protein
MTPQGDRGDTATAHSDPIPASPILVPTTIKLATRAPGTSAPPDEPPATQDTTEDEPNMTPNDEPAPTTNGEPTLTTVDKPTLTTDDKPAPTASADGEHVSTEEAAAASRKKPRTKKHNEGEPAKRKSSRIVGKTTGQTTSGTTGETTGETTGGTTGETGETAGETGETAGRSKKQKKASKP